MSYSSADLKTLWRDDVADQAEPFLWSDDVFYAYLDDAATMFARLTDGIEDSRTPEVTQLAIAPYDVMTNPTPEWVALDKRILKIRSAYRTDTGRPVALLTPEKMQNYGVRFDGRLGPVDAMVQGLEKHALRVYPVPNETVTVQLSVFRLPLVQISADNDSDSPECDDQHMLSLLTWVKHRAYAKQDQDTYDKKKSQDFKALFEAYCEQAKHEQQRARHNAGAVVYGGEPLSAGLRGRNDYHNRSY